MKIHTYGELLDMPTSNLRESNARKYPGDWNKPTPLVSVYENENSKKPIDILVRIGDWFVSTEGDLLFNKLGCDAQTLKKLNYYAIYSEQLEESDWILHLSGKDWFTTCAYEDFKQAYCLACAIAKVKPAKQQRNY